MEKYLAIATFLVGCGVEPADVPSVVRDKVPDGLLQQFEDAQEHSFIVAVPAAIPTERGMRVARIASRVDVAVEHDWDQLPLVQVRAASLEAALDVIDSDDVEEAFETREYQLNDAQSFPLINQPAAAAAGKIGAGTSVAVLDTGTNYKLAELGSCTAPGVPASCRVAYAADFAPSDNSLDDNGHGTNVAGIVAGTAPGTKILALDVFTGGGASSTTLLTAINWVIANRATYNIASLNMSLGGGSSTVPCTGDAIGAALVTARAAGVAPVVASGNNGFTNAISWPACAPSAISVGAVYDANVGGLGFSSCSDPTTAADKVTCFSNSASFLSVLAPGALITAGGYTMAGTSQATPHVAGAFAVMRAAFPANTVDQSLARLTSTGKRVTDARNNITTPRIDLGAAVASAAPADTTPPTGTVRLATGSTVTRTAAVTLALAASDASGVAQMCVSNTTTCTAFEAFAAQKAWTLTAGDGAKVVTVFLRDTKGNTTTATTSPRAEIRLDVTAPVNGTVKATAVSGSVSLTWSGFTDAGTGIAGYRVAVAMGATAPTSCATAVYAGTATTYTHASLTNGAAYSYRVCALDGAGNTSAGAVVTATPHELVAPIGSVKINAGAVRTRTLAVTLTLAATDASGVTQMCISSTATCTTWVAYATTAAFTFTAGEGTRTVRAWFRDKWGNTSLGASASILVDTLAPTNATISSTATAGRIALSWTASTDTGSGLASYRLVGLAGTLAPVSCAAGTTLYQGANRAFTHPVAVKATWTYRLCALDVAGNVSTGAAKTATAL